MPVIRRQEKPLRQLSRVVGYKTQTTASDIEQKYKDEGYVIEKEGGKFKRIYKPEVAFTKLKEYSGGQWAEQKGKYIPHEFIFDEQGNLIKEVKRGTYQEFKQLGGNKKETQNIYEKEIKTYFDGYIKSLEKYSDYNKPSATGKTERGRVNLEEKKLFDKGYLTYEKQVSYNTYGQRQNLYEKNWETGQVKERHDTPFVRSYSQVGITPIIQREGESTTDYMVRKAKEESARTSLIKSGVSVSDINKMDISGITAAEFKSSMDMYKTPQELSKVFTGTSALTQAKLSPEQVETAVKFGVLKERYPSYKTEVRSGNIQLTGTGKIGDIPVKTLQATKELLPSETIILEPVEKDISKITGMGVVKTDNIWDKILGKQKESKVDIKIGEPQMPEFTGTMLPKYIEGKLVLGDKDIKIPSVGMYTVTPKMYSAETPNIAKKYTLTYKDGKLVSMVPGKEEPLWEGEKEPLRQQWEDEKRTYIQRGMGGITGGSILEKPLEPYSSILRGPISVKKPIETQLWEPETTETIPFELLPKSPVADIYGQPELKMSQFEIKEPILQKPKYEEEERGVMDTSVPQSKWFKKGPEQTELARRIAELNLAILKSKEEKLLGTDSKELKKIQKEREKLEAEISLLYPNVNATKLINQTKGKDAVEISKKLQELGRLEGKTISIVEKGAAEREIPLELKYNDLVKKSQTISAEFALLNLSNANLLKETEKYNTWLNQTQTTVDELEKKTLSGSKEDIDKYNMFIKNIKNENEEKLKNLELQKKQVDDKFGSYSEREEELLIEFDEYNKEADKYNKYIEAREELAKKDLKTLQKAEEEYRNKYYEQKTYFGESDVPGISAQPTYAWVLKEPKASFLPGVISKSFPQQLEYEKDTDKINKLREAYNKKYFPVKKIEKIDIEDIKKFGIEQGVLNVDTTTAFKLRDAIESGQLKVVVKDKLSPNEIHARDVRKIIQDSGVPLRQTLEKDTTFEQLKNIQTTPFVKRKTDDETIQYLQDKITRAEEIKAGKRAGTVLAYGLGTAALPTALTYVAGIKAPVVKYTAGLLAKGLLSKPGQIGMLALYTGSVGWRGYEGVRDKDYDKLLDLGYEVAGVGAGMAWYTGADGKPYSKLKNIWAGRQVSAYKTPYSVSDKLIQAVSIKPALAKPVKGGTITYEPVSPKQFEATITEQGVRYNPIDSQLTFMGRAKTPGFADFIAKQNLGPIKGVEVIQPGGKISTKLQQEFTITPSTQRAFIEGKLYAKSKGLGVVERREIKLIENGVLTKNPKTGKWEKFDSNKYEIETIDEGQFGYERPLTISEKAAIYKITKPVETSVQTTLTKYQQQTPSTTQELFKLEGLEVVDVKPDGSLLVRGRQTTPGREIVIEEISAKDPRNIKVIDELVARASTPYKSEIELLAEKIQVDRVIQDTKAKRLTKETQKKVRAEAIKKKQTFAEQPSGQQVTQMEVSQKYIGRYPGTKYTYQQEPQYKGVAVGGRTEFLSLAPTIGTLTSGSYITKPMQFGKVLYEQEQIIRPKIDLAEKLGLKQKTELSTMSILQSKQYQPVEYVQKDIIQQESRQRKEQDSPQVQDEITIPDIPTPTMPTPMPYQPGMPVFDILRPITGIGFIGGGGFWPQASGGYGSGRAVRSWTVTNPLKNIQQQFKIRQKIKTMQELEQRRKKELPQQAANRAFKPIRKLDVGQIKDIVGSK